MNSINENQRMEEITGKIMFLTHIKDIVRKSPKLDEIKEIKENNNDEVIKISDLDTSSGEDKSPAVKKKKWRQGRNSKISPNFSRNSDVLKPQSKSLFYSDVVSSIIGNRKNELYCYLM